MISNLDDSAAPAVALYHAILVTESLSTGAEHVLAILQKAQREHPGRPRKLYLDIDGRRTPNGVFLPDVQVFLADIVRGFFAQFVSELSVAGSVVATTGKQRNDIPDKIPLQ